MDIHYCFRFENQLSTNVLYPLSTRAVTPFSQFCTTNKNGNSSRYNTWLTHALHLLQHCSFNICTHKASLPLFFPLSAAFIIHIPHVYMSKTLTRFGCVPNDPACKTNVTSAQHKVVVLLLIESTDTRTDFPRQRSRVNFTRDNNQINTKLMYSTPFFVLSLAPIPTRLHSRVSRSFHSPSTHHSQFLS